MKPYLVADRSKDMYVGTAAARNSYNLHMENIMLWLPGVLDFTTVDFETPQVLCQFWEMLCIDSKMLPRCAMMLFEFGLWVSGWGWGHLFGTKYG